MPELHSLKEQLIQDPYSLALLQDGQKGEEDSESEFREDLKAATSGSEDEIEALAGWQSSLQDDTTSPARMLQRRAMRMGQISSRAPMKRALRTETTPRCSLRRSRPSRRW